MGFDASWGKPALLLEYLDVLVKQAGLPRGDGRCAGWGRRKDLTISQVGQEMVQGSAPLLEGSRLVWELRQEDVNPVGELIQGRVGLPLDEGGQVQEAIGIQHEGG